PWSELPRQRPPVHELANRFVRFSRYVRARQRGGLVYRPCQQCCNTFRWFTSFCPTERSLGRGLRRSPRRTARRRARRINRDSARGLDETPEFCERVAKISLLVQNIIVGEEPRPVPLVTMQETSGWIVDEVFISVR